MLRVLDTRFFLQIVLYDDDDAARATSIYLSRECTLKERCYMLIMVV
jgi:hypothetical protein